MNNSQQHYSNALLLSAVGDALGYKNQQWEYCKSGITIHKELEALGGLENIVVELPDWPVSDDTVMHLATAEGMLDKYNSDEEMYLNIARKYKECMNDMEGRKPGPTSIKGCSELRPGEAGGYRIPFNTSGTGCGAAMRSMCIGLRYPRESEVEDVIRVSIECGRMTHHHPTGYLGSLASALMLSYAVQRKPLESWGMSIVNTLPKAWQYIESDGYCVEESRKQFQYFEYTWRAYLITRELHEDSPKGAVFPEKYGVEERDEIYKTLSLDAWAGRSGHDAPMIAYDALLASGDSWPELCSRSMFHGGDSDSTGVIAAACYGVLHGLGGVPEGNHGRVEYRARLLDVAQRLWQLANTHR